MKKETQADPSMQKLADLIDETSIAMLIDPVMNRTREH